MPAPIFLTHSNRDAVVTRAVERLGFQPPAKVARNCGLRPAETELLGLLLTGANPYLIAANWPGTTGEELAGMLCVTGIALLKSEYHPQEVAVKLGRTRTTEVDTLIADFLGGYHSEHRRAGNVVRRVLTTFLVEDTLEPKQGVCPQCHCLVSLPCLKCYHTRVNHRRKLCF